MSETDETRRKRLLYQSWHRGSREADLILGNFAERNLAGMSPEDLGVFDALLAGEEADLWVWMTGAEPPPAEHDTPVMRRLRAFRFASTLGLDLPESESAQSA